MSVGDIKGYRRRIRAFQKLGHFPRKSGRSVGESIEYNRRIAAKAAKASKKK